jgi:hypothetical protein
MSKPGADAIVSDYFSRLRRALAPLPRTRRDQLMDDLMDHVTAARAGLTHESEASVRDIFDHLGEPEDIAAEALAAEALPADIRASGRRRLGSALLTRCYAIVSVRARTRHRRRPWIVLVTAAAAVIAIAVALVIALTSQPPAASPGIPAYYVALNDALSQRSPDQVVVGSTFTGARLATVSPPAHGTFVGMTGAADDRTFVLGAQPFPFSPSWWGEEPRTWYLLRIAPGTDDPARLARLPIPATPFGLEVAGMALSPDGSEFAVALEPNTTMTSGPELLRIYSVATGALLRTWTGPPSNVTWDGYLGRDNNTTLSWLADGHTLVFDYGAGGRMLDTSRPGHDLIAGSRPTAWSISVNACSRPVVTSDGKTVVCATADSQGIAETTGGTCSGALVEYLTATGTPARTLYQANCGTDGEVLWVSPSGEALIGYLNKPGQSSPVVGVITQGKFRSLAFPLASGVPLPDGVAW